MTKTLLTEKILSEIDQRVNKNMKRHEQGILHDNGPDFIERSKNWTLVQT